MAFAVRAKSRQFSDKLIYKESLAMQHTHQGKHFLRLIFTGLCLVFLSVSVLAQFRATLQGTVLDNTGAVVPGATVILTSKETNQTQQTVASEDGFYRFTGFRSRRKASRRKCLKTSRSMPSSCRASTSNSKPA
jgi:hypothetical protein